MSASPSAFPVPDDWLAAGVMARHETFCPRYGWLKKAVERLAGVPGRAPEPEVFDAPDATAGAFFDRETRNGADVQRPASYWRPRLPPSSASAPNGPSKACLSPVERLR